MTTKNSAGLCPTVARADLLDAGSQRTGGLGLAAAALLSLCLVGAAGPALGQAANELGLCTLSSDTIAELETDVEVGIGIEAGVEVAFVVVYSLNNDNHGQPVSGGGTTGPLLCVNEDVTDEPSPTSATEQIPDNGGTVDILDSAEAFVLRYEDSESFAPETRFCHTTNANVDCFLLGPTPESEID